MVYFVKKNKLTHLVIHSGQSHDEMELEWECSCETFELAWAWWTETAVLQELHGNVVMYWH